LRSLLGFIVWYDIVTPFRPIKDSMVCQSDAKDNETGDGSAGRPSPSGSTSVLRTSRFWLALDFGCSLTDLCLATSKSVITLKARRNSHKIASPKLDPCACSQVRRLARRLSSLYDIASDKLWEASAPRPSESPFKNKQIKANCFKLFSEKKAACIAHKPLRICERCRLGSAGLNLPASGF
jgi:hypothetical protein